MKIKKFPYPIPLTGTVLVLIQGLFANTSPGNSISRGTTCPTIDAG
ncbi:MAG: hypothetical protein ACK2U1_18115 [Anaerolineales bacterium]|jgi:hypothetical protein